MTTWHMLFFLAVLAEATYSLNSPLINQIYCQMERGISMILTISKLNGEYTLSLVLKNNLWVKDIWIEIYLDIYSKIIVTWALANRSHAPDCPVYQSGKCTFCILATLVKMVLPPFGPYFWMFQFTKGELLGKKPFTNVAKCQTLRIKKYIVYIFYT